MQTRDTETMAVRNKNLLSVHDVSLRIGRSESVVRNKHCKSAYTYDASFPKPIKLGPRSVRYWEFEIDDWIEVKQKDELLRSSAK